MFLSTLQFSRTKRSYHNFSCPLRVPKEMKPLYIVYFTIFLRTVTYSGSSVPTKLSLWIPTQILSRHVFLFFSGVIYFYFLLYFLTYWFSFPAWFFFYIYFSPYLFSIQGLEEKYRRWTAIEKDSIVNTCRLTYNLTWLPRGPQQATDSEFGPLFFISTKTLFKHFVCNRRILLAKKSAHYSLPLSQTFKQMGMTKHSSSANSLWSLLRICRGL